MIARLKDMTFSRDGEQIITLATREDIRELFDELRDCEVVVTIKKNRKRRSQDANAYAWVLIDKLAERTKIPKVEIYREAVRNIGGVSEVVCVREKAFDELKRLWSRNGLGWQVEQMPSKIDGCVIAILIKGSSEYDTKQMSDLLSILIQDCEAQGIPTATPDEVAEKLSLWAEAPKQKGAKE